MDKQVPKYPLGVLYDKTKEQLETIQSFDYQWKHLSRGSAQLSNPEWRANLPILISQLTQLPMEWFQGRKVLDAGCGNGRFAHGLSELLKANVLAFDAAESGVEISRRIAPHADFICADVLDLQITEQFDLVWCFGVLHHTGDTRRGFNALAALVKPGGYYYTMLYGQYLDAYRKWRDFFRRFHVPFRLRAALLAVAKPADRLHGWFDATSTAINDTHTFEEIRSWYLDAGFEDITRTTLSGNDPHHNTTARKKQDVT